MGPAQIENTRGGGMVDKRHGPDKCTGETLNLIKTVHDPIWVALDVGTVDWMSSMALAELPAYWDGASATCAYASGDQPQKERKCTAGNGWKQVSRDAFQDLFFPFLSLARWKMQFVYMCCCYGICI